MPDHSAKITLKMIAQQAGTSIGTVDRALSNRAGINPVTKDRILQVAKALGYRPNRFASALSRKRIIRIGMVYPSEPAGFYDDIDAGVDQAARELAAYGVTIEKLRYHSQDPVEQALALESLDPTAFDGLAINAAGPAIGQKIDQLMSCLPVMTFNTDAADSSRLFFVGNDSLQSGRMGAELLGRYLGGQGGVTVMGNFMQAMPFTERFGGFCEVIHQAFPGITLYPCAECRSDPTVAAKNLLAALSQVPTMRGIYCTGHSSTLGAIAALKQLSRKDIVLIGFDVGGGSLEALAEDWCDALLFQDPFKQAYQAARLLTKHILEGWMPPKPLLHVETRIVIKANLATYASHGMQWDSEL